MGDIKEEAARLRRHYAARARLVVHARVYDPKFIINYNNPANCGGRVYRPRIRNPARIIFRPPPSYVPSMATKDRFSPIAGFICPGFPLFPRDSRVKCPGFPEPNFHARGIYAPYVHFPVEMPPHTKFRLTPANSNTARREKSYILDKHDHVASTTAAHAARE